MNFNFSVLSKLLQAKIPITAPTMTHIEPSILVNLYTDQESPQRWFFVFRNTSGRTLRLSEGRLPWHDGATWDLEAHLLTNGRTTRLAAEPPIDPRGFDLELAAGSVLSGSVYFRDVIRDFDRMLREGDILVRLLINSTPRTGQPHFFSAPTIILVPYSDSTNTRCPGVISFSSGI